MPRRNEEPMEQDPPAAEQRGEEQMEQDAPAADYTFNARGMPEFPEVEVPPAPEAVASFDVNGPRLMITHIVNEYFKSYAGTQILGPFHKSFSSIIGPNGSGKSNVIDSMLFVFGYRANKIRSKKISVLIHNSEQHPNCQSCTVAVHFQKIIDTGSGDEDYDVVPNSKFVVSRTAFKDNSSYYKVNDKKAQYKEVAALLRGSGIDLDHNRFLILQGEVEQIAMMKPKAQTEHDEGMLEFLEDIIGSSRFKEPIETLTKRVETLNELRAEKLNRVKAVEKEKDELEGVKNEAIEYLKLENDITKKKNELWQHYKSELSENQDKATKKLEEIQEGMTETTKKLDELKDLRKAKGKEQKKIFKKHEVLTKECEDKKEQFSAFEREDVRCREDLKHAKAKSKKLDKTLEQEKKRLSELKMIPEKSERDIAEFKKKQEKLEVEKAKEDEKLKEVMESLKTETQELQAEKDVKETKLLELQKGVNETKSTMNVAQSELELYMKNQQKEQMKLKETTKHYELATNKLKDRKDAIQELEKRIPENEKGLEKAKRDLEQAAQEEIRLQNEVRQTRVKVEEARSSMSASRSRGRILEALMAEKNAGRITGIFGRLGDLGAIDEKYDIAVSTACGPLDNIVVDTINTAQKCVEFLRRSGIGSATFMGLDKMKRWESYCSRRINTPENVPRLFDLIKVKDPQILPAFYFAVRDTLVANDLEQGTRIAYGKTRYRVVTLQGQLIDLSGTMSGGGSRVSKGRMSSKVVEEEVDPRVLEKLEHQLQSSSREAQTVHQNKVELERTIEKVQKSLTDMRHSLQKFKAEVQSLIEQERDLKVQLAEQEERVKAAAPDEKTLKQLEKKLEGYRSEYKKAQDAASKVEDEVHVLHKQIMEVGGAKLKSAEMRVSHITMQIDQIVGHITKANVAIKNAQRNTNKCEDKVTSIEDEQKETAELITKLEAEFKKLEEDATKVLQEYQKAQEEMKTVDDEVAAVGEELKKIELEEEEIQKDNMEVKHELERIEGIIKENAHRIKHWNKELGKLALHEIDGIEKETLPELDKEKLEDLDSEDIKYQITVLEEKVAQMKPNMAAIAEYKKKETQYLKRVGELDEITEYRDAQRKQHDDMRRTRADEFMTGFGVITNKLKEMYQMITLGGDAELELVDTLDPFAEGIVFSVRPPKKSWKNISNLSGGEKTLSSLALVFALHHYKPTPLYVMDEIDAALDFKNVSIVANYIKERTKNAQFIIISLRNNMFELADRLIGIYKTYNATKSVTVNPKTIGVSQIEAAAAAIQETGSKKSVLTAAINDAASQMDVPAVS